MASSNEQVLSTQTKERKKDKRRVKAQRAHMQAHIGECKPSSESSQNCAEKSRTQFILSNSEFNDKYNHEDVLCATTGKMSNHSSLLVKEENELLYEEDVIDGFAILSFLSYEDLEGTVKVFEKTSQLPDPCRQLDTKENVKKSKQEKLKHSRVNGAVRNWLTKEGSAGKSFAVSGLDSETDKASREAKKTTNERAALNECCGQSNSTQEHSCECEMERRKVLPDVKPNTPAAPKTVDPTCRPTHFTTHSMGPSSSSASPGENSAMRWVGLASSPRPATAVAPHGPIQSGPRLPDCQPTEGGAGPSPAPPATHSPQLAPRSTGSPQGGVSHPASSPFINPNFRASFPSHPMTFSSPSPCMAPANSMMTNQPFLPSPTSSGSPLAAAPVSLAAAPSSSFPVPEARTKDGNSSAGPLLHHSRQARPLPSQMPSPVSKASPAMVPSSLSYASSPSQQLSQATNSQPVLAQSSSRPASRHATIPATTASVTAPSPPCFPPRPASGASSLALDQRNSAATAYSATPRSMAPENSPFVSSVQPRYPPQSAKAQPNLPPIPPTFQPPSLSSSWPRLPQPEMYGSPGLGPRLPLPFGPGSDRLFPGRELQIPVSSSSHTLPSHLVQSAPSSALSNQMRRDMNSKFAGPPSADRVTHENSGGASKSSDPPLFRSMHQPYQGLQSVGGPPVNSLPGSLGPPLANPGTVAAQRNPGLHSGLPEFVNKQGRWNTMHVRVAWEIYRQQQLQQPDRKSTLTASIPSRLNFSSAAPSRLPNNPYESAPSAKAASPFPYSHSISSLIPRHANSQPVHRTATPPPSSHHSLPSRRPSPALEAWNRLPGSSATVSSAAPWLAPLARSSVTSMARSDSLITTTPSTSSSHTSSNARERDWQKREERTREREKSENEREKEKERVRHSSRSPLQHRTPHSNGSLRNESPAVRSLPYPPVGSAHPLPHLGGFHPGLQVAHSTAGPGSGLLSFPHSFDPFRDLPRDVDPLRESFEREQREYLRLGAGSSLMHHPPVGLPPPIPPPPLFHATPPVSSAAGERYPDFSALTSTLAPDRFRDGLLLPGHLAHMQSLPALQLPSSSFGDRYRELASYTGGLSALHGMGAGPLYNPAVSTVMFPPGPAPPPLLSTAGLGGVGGMPLLPPLLPGAGKRTPPPSTLAPTLGNTFASLGRNHLGMVPPGLGIPPYPLPSPSPLLPPHLLPPLGPPGLGSAATSVGRSLLDMPPPLGSGLPGYNPLDFQRKDDSQNR